MDDYIQIVITGIIQTTVTVKRSDSISSIMKNLTDVDSIALFDGKQLEPSLSLMFYGIDQMSVVTILSIEKIPNEKNQDRPKLSKFEKYSNLATANNKRVNDFFNSQCRGRIKEDNLQRFQDAMNPFTTREYARLTDIYKSRIENNRYWYRKLCQKYSSIDDLDKVNSDNLPTIVPEKANEPSSELLPMLSEQSSKD